MATEAEWVGLGTWPSVGRKQVLLASAGLAPLLELEVATRLGQPRLSAEVRGLIARMSWENRLWGTHGFALDHSVKQAPAMLKELKDYLEQADRRASDFGLAARVRLGRSTEEVLAEAAAWQALGITHLSLNTMNAGLSGPAGHLEAAVKFLAEWQHRSGDWRLLEA